MFALAVPRSRQLLSWFVIGILLTLAFFLAGCSTTTVAPTPVPEASSAEPVAKPTSVLVNAFGDTVSYKDNVSVSVSTPTEFTPSEYAAGNVAGMTNVAFKIVITNGSTEVYKPMIYATLSSGGVEGSQVFDSGNEVGEMGIYPMTPVLPGQTIEWVQGFSVKDPSSLTMQINPSPLVYDNLIFTNVK